MAKAAPWKKDRVSELTEILSNDGIVGIVDIGGVPAGNMLDMRSSLRDRMTMTMAKTMVISSAEQIVMTMMMMETIRTLTETVGSNLFGTGAR